MAEPEFGNCRDCACWIKPVEYLRLEKHRECCRHPSAPTKRFDDGCFDHIPKRETTHAG